MHEMSIAEELLEQVRHYAPPGTKVMKVSIEVGAQQSLDAEAMKFAWRAVTEGIGFAGAVLSVATLPWRCRCKMCGHGWEDADPFAACPACRSIETEPLGSNVLR